MEHLFPVLQPQAVAAVPTGIGTADTLPPGQAVEVSPLQPIKPVSAVVSLYVLISSEAALI